MYFFAVNIRTYLRYGIENVRDGRIGVFMKISKKIHSDIKNLEGILHALPNMKKKAIRKIVRDDKLPYLRRIRGYISILENKNQNLVKILDDFDLSTKEGRLVYNIISGLNEFAIEQEEGTE